MLTCAHVSECCNTERRSCSDASSYSCPASSGTAWASGQPQTGNPFRILGD